MTNAGATEVRSDVTRWAEAAFAGGFAEGDSARPEHRRETALGLVYAVARHGVRFGQLRAFALSLRDIADLCDGRELGAAQREALDALVRDPCLPVPLAAVMRAARPHLRSGMDLDVFAGVAAGAVEAAAAVREVLELSGAVAREDE